jgi:multidrug efflux pump subunit AcrA (membrane-fusion protein)
VVASIRTLPPAVIAQHTVESLYAEHGPQRPGTYWLILAGVSGALASLPLIKVDVSVRAPGLVRPLTERTELRPAGSGQIAEVLVRENDRVYAGQPLLVLRSRNLEERLARNRAQQAERATLIADSVLLTANAREETQRKGNFNCGLYGQNG